MNRKFLLLLLMSGCCEVQASAGRNGHHSGYTGVLGDPLGMAAAAVGMGAKALWNGWGASSTSTIAATEGAVVPVEVEQVGAAREQEVLLPVGLAEVVNPKIQTMSMIQYVVDVYVRSKTSFITIEPGTLRVKNATTTEECMWTFPVHNEEAMKQFCRTYNALLGATDQQIVKKYFSEIVCLSNTLNGYPLDEASLRVVLADVAEKIDAIMAERAEKKAQEEAMVAGLAREKRKTARAARRLVAQGQGAVSHDALSVASLASEPADNAASVPVAVVSCSPVAVSSDRRSVHFPDTADLVQVRLFEQYSQELAIQGADDQEIGVTAVVDQVQVSEALLRRISPAVSPKTSLTIWTFNLSKKSPVLADLFLKNKPVILQNNLLAHVINGDAIQFRNDDGDVVIDFPALPLEDVENICASFNTALTEVYGSQE